MSAILIAIGKFFLDIIETIVMALAIFVIVYLFLFQPHKVSGNSMFPNFHDVEFILTDKLSYRFNFPKKGDVVVFRSPQNKRFDYIKRIIGMPKDTVLIENGYVYVNDQKINEAYLPEDFLTSGGQYIPEGLLTTVPENEYFVLGDNRNQSSDSREFGTIKKEDIVGRAFFRYWPPNRIGLIPKASY